MAYSACIPDEKCLATQPRPMLDEAACIVDEECPGNMACNSKSGECYNPCTNPSFKCKQNKKCEVHNHRAKCVCKNGFTVNEHGELACAPDLLECNLDKQCSSDKACIEGRCQNPCTASKKAPCPKDKSCEVLNHQPICICMKDCSPSLSICLRDNGCPRNQACRVFKCVDPCKTASCPADTPCYVEDHKPICKFCPPGFISDAKFGCLKGKINFFTGTLVIELDEINIKSTNDSLIHYKLLLCYVVTYLQIMAKLLPEKWSLRKLYLKPPYLW